MKYNFLEKISFHKRKEPDIKELLAEEKREIRQLSFTQNEDEKVIFEFLNDIDKSFGYSTKDRLAQGEAFEQFLAAAFRLGGFQVDITKKSYEQGEIKYLGDRDVGLILIKDQERIAVQAKHFRLNARDTKLINKNCVNSYAGISDEGWTRKLFITTSLFNGYFYEELEKNEKAKEIEWYDRYGMLQLLNQLIPNTMAKYNFLNSLPKQIKKCPKCASGFMISKYGSRGYFRSCTSFPKCKYSENIEA